MSLYDANDISLLNIVSLYHANNMSLYNVSLSCKWYISVDSIVSLYDANDISLLTLECLSIMQIIWLF